MDILVAQKDNKVNIFAAGILFVMALLMLGSMAGDSAIIDELAHIPAGYSYLFLKDYRLNPEHPPLAKIIAALPLALQKNIHFPTDTQAWQQDINGQWDQGRIFLYESGNNADAVIFWMRVPMVLLTILLGWLLFSWTKKRFGNTPALFALLFYAFSPTIIAHGRFVTTDIAASLGFFIGLTAFLQFLESPTWKNLLWAGLAFGIAQLLKFSLFLLIPIQSILLILWAVSAGYLSKKDRLVLFLKLAGKTILIGILGILVIWLVYGYATWNYPQERQLRDAATILNSFGNRTLVDINLGLIKQPLLRPLGEYFLGILMVVQRVAGGNAVYFLGEVNNGGSPWYFPVTYLFKEPLPLHLFTLIALVTAFGALIRTKEKSLAKTLVWMHAHFAEVTAFSFIAFYWAYSMRSTLNIGVRHLLPTFPFIYILVALGVSRWLHGVIWSSPRSWFGFFKNIYERYFKIIPRYIAVGVLLLWLVAGTIAVSPHFLSFFNILGGGTINGYQYVADSNYDWGQDLKRLHAYMDEHGIQKINLDYFGGGSPKNELGERFEPWWSARGAPASGEWFAISATFQMGAFGKPTKGFIRKPEDSYEWLRQFQPVGRAGTSIFIYQIP